MPSHENITKIVGIIIILYILCQIFHNQYEHYKQNDDDDNSATQDISNIFESKEFTVGDLNVTKDFNMLPRGCIIAWTGKIAPDGWALCDGKEHQSSDGTSVKTPD